LRNEPNLAESETNETTCTPCETNPILGPQPLAPGPLATDPRPPAPGPRSPAPTCTACETNPIPPENPAPVPVPPTPAPGPRPLAPCPRRFSVTIRHEAILARSDPGAGLVEPERAGL
jgi:hypothetical protein